MEARIDGGDRFLDDREGTMTRRKVMERPEGATSRREAGTSGEQGGDRENGGF